MNQIYDEIIKKAKINTIDNVRAHQRGLIPFMPKARLLNCDRYRYRGRTYSYAYSDEDRDSAYGIISIDRKDMPFRPFAVYKSDQSFISRLDSLIINDKMDAIMLFINGRFVKWENIDVIYDCGNVWFKVYGKQYNYFSIKQIDMIVIPSHISYISIEPEYQFNRYFDYICKYISESARVRTVAGVNRLVIKIPRISDVYETEDGEIIEVGVWYYNQLKSYYTGLLSSDRQAKLKRIAVNKTSYNNDSTIDRVYNTFVNLLDEDSIIKAQLDHVMNMNADVISNNTLFRFNSDGLLDYSDSSETIIANLNDYNFEHDGRYKDLEFNMTTYNLRPNESSNMDYSYRDNDGILYRENYIVFRDGMICNAVENIHIGEYAGQGYNRLYIPTNGFKVYNYFDTVEFNDGDDDIIRNGLWAANGDHLTPDQTKTYKIDVLKFYDRSLHRVNNLAYKIPNMYLMVNDLESHFNNGDNAYLEYMLKSLSYTYSDHNILSDNQDLGFDMVTKHDMMMFNPLYEKINKYKSSVMTGKFVNDNLVKDGFFNISPVDWGYSDDTKLYTLTVQRMQQHEFMSYVMLFVNGILIDHYDKARVFPNKICIPLIGSKFNNSDVIEFFYLNSCNNNELVFTLEDEDGEVNRYCPYLSNKFTAEELNIYTGEYQLDPDLLVYPNMVYDEKEIAFAIKYDIDDDNNITLDVPNESLLYNKPLIMTSENKFVYQRFDNGDDVKYMFKLNGRFRYCSNQLQYMVFINGRKLNHHDYLITIPKLSRPFNGIYLYLMRFANPGDRVEVFYIPIKCYDFAHDNLMTIDNTGYINVDERLITYPFIPDTYFVFINGKKVASSDILQLNSRLFKITRDYLSYKNLSIIPLIEHHPYDELNEFLHNEEKMCDWDAGIYELLNNTDGYNKINSLFGDYMTQSDLEIDHLSISVGRIAIINEIIRDFWVSNGFEYNLDKFLYDYFIDSEYQEAIVYDEANQAYILPAMDAGAMQYDEKEGKNVFLNIDHDTTAYHLFFSFLLPDANKQSKMFMEIGEQLTSFILHWAYNDYYKHSRLVYQKLFSETLNNNFFDANGTPITIDPPTSIGVPITGSDNPNARYYAYEVSDDGRIIIDSTDPTQRYFKFRIKTSDGTEIYNSYLELEFVNATYYGLIDEDKLDQRPEPDTGEVPDIDGADIIGELNKVLNNNGEILLEDYEMQNNKYFIYAIPKRYKDSGLLEFYLPELSSFTDDDIDPDTALTNVPLLTNGKYKTDGEIVDPAGAYYRDNLVSLDEYTIEELMEFDYINSEGFIETYIIYKTNGYFTKLKSGTKVHISVKPRTLE